ncbi:MAG: hypothetical protein RBR74_02275 [Ignavibacteriaceae bacterium]|jgi:hypothetical protein|nr:hypothetical protein [Ignavibacteriaceae bacterium]
MKSATIVLALFFVLNFSTLTNAQVCCGIDAIAGMLLQSGVYGGYGVQQFSAAGFNDYIKHYNEKRPALTQKMDEFGFAYGWRAGANIIQFQDKNMLYGLNVFYQQTIEKHQANAMLPNDITGKREYKLTLASYGFGFAASYVINKSFDYKIIDAKLNWNKATLINKYTEGTNPSTEQKLQNPDASIGGQVSTGILFYPLPPYISIEVNAGYSYFTIDEMQFESTSTYLAKNEDSNEKMENFIDGGGFFAFAQLNIALPF